MSDATLPEALREHYRVVRDLGEGGMGRVFLAEHVRDGSLASVKVLFAQQDAAGRTLFEREALALMELDHPGLPQLRRFGFTEAGEPYLALDYIPGFPLDQLPTGTDPLEPMLQVAEALDAMHRSGLVHRDVKPANILCDGAGRAWLIDLGIAWSPDMDTGERERVVLGTLAYLSPRRLRGEPAGPEDDWHAWAATLYELHEGSPPFTEEELYEAARTRRSPDLHFGTLPSGERRAALLASLLGDDPDAPGSARDIRRFLEGEARPPPARGIDRSAPTALQSQTGAVLAAPVVAQATRRLELTTTVEPTAPAPPLRLAGPETPAQRGALVAVAGAVLGIWGLALWGPSFGGGGKALPPASPRPGDPVAVSPRPAPAEPATAAPSPAPSPLPPRPPSPEPVPATRPAPSPSPVASPPPSPAAPSPAPASPPAPTPRPASPPQETGLPEVTAPTRLPSTEPRDRIWMVTPSRAMPLEVSLAELEGSEVFQRARRGAEASPHLFRDPVAAGGDRVVMRLFRGTVGIWEGHPRRLSTVILAGEDHNVWELALGTAGNLLVLTGYRPDPLAPDFSTSFVQFWDLSVLRLLSYREVSSSPGELWSPGPGQVVLAEARRGPVRYTLDELLRAPSDTFQRLPRYGGPAPGGTPTTEPPPTRYPAAVRPEAGIHILPGHALAVGRSDDGEIVLFDPTTGRRDPERVWVGDVPPGTPVLTSTRQVVIPDPRTLKLERVLFPR